MRFSVWVHETRKLNAEVNGSRVNLMKSHQEHFGDLMNNY